jgi:hypothetical protein
VSVWCCVGVATCPRLATVYCSRTRASIGCLLAVRERVHRSNPGEAVVIVHRSVPWRPRVRRHVAHTLGLKDSQGTTAS